MGMGEGVRTRSPRRLTRSVNSPKPWDVSAAYSSPEPSAISESESSLFNWLEHD